MLSRHAHTQNSLKQAPESLIPYSCPLQNPLAFSRPSHPPGIRPIPPASHFTSPTAQSALP